MGKSDPEPREMVSRLALSCSALARAGQLLSAVTDPAKTEDAVRQATSILESDARASRLSQMETVARECRSSLEGVGSPERVAVCRKLATKLARLASTLATEVQEQTRKAAKPELRPATAAPAPQVRQPVAPAPTTAKPTPRPPMAPATPARAPKTREVQPASEPRPMKPRIDVTPIRVAVTAEEREAVVAALEDGRRFAPVANGTVIDTGMKLMWAVKAGPAMSHRDAQGYAAEYRLAGYTNWRLPRPDELQHFLIGGGRDFGPIMFDGVGGSPTVALWTAETSRRWFFIRQATVVQFETGSVTVASARRSDVYVLVVRGASGERQGMPFA